MRNDEIPSPRGSTKAALKLGSLPTAGLASRLAIGHLTRWRDDQGEKRGPRAADARVQLLRRALAVMVKQGVAPANPAAGLMEVWTADRSALIWEPELVKKYLEHIKAEIWWVWTTVSASNPLRPAMILKLAAARDALLLVLNNGQRREDLAALNWRECTDVAFIYTASKGARRAKTAGKKSRTTIVPILNEARQVLIRRKAAHGDDSPWVIISGRGGAYTANSLGELVNGIARALEIDRHLHDGKGTFVTRIKSQAPWLSNGEIAAMVDWSEGEVDEIIRRYVSADAIARATIERLHEQRKAN
jgi:integrase